MVHLNVNTFAKQVNDALFSSFLSNGAAESSYHSKVEDICLLK